MKKTMTLGVAMTALTLSAQAASVAVGNSTSTYGATQGVAIDFDATTGITADWMPDISASTTYNINSVSLRESNSVDANIFLAVYTGFDGTNLSGFLGASTNSVNFSTNTDGTLVSWSFADGITVTPDTTAGGGAGVRYFIFQTVNTAESAVGTTDYGVRRANANFDDRLSAIVRRGQVPVANRAPDYEATITAVPEPSSTALLGLGGLALILRRRK